MGELAVIEKAKKAVAAWSSDQWDAIKGNGCTGGPDLWMETACQRHDRHYETHRHRDGRQISRLSADWELAKDAWKSLPVVPKDVKLTLKTAAPLAVIVPARAAAKVVVPPVVFVLVRLFGWSHW